MGFLKNFGTEEAAHNDIGRISNVVGRVGDALNVMNGAPQTYGAFHDQQQAHWNDENARNAFGTLLSNPEDHNSFAMLAKANPGLAIQFMGALKKQAVEPTNTEKVYNFLKGQLGEAGATDYLHNISMGTPVAVDSYDEQGNPVRQFLPRSQVTGQGGQQTHPAPQSAVPSNMPIGSPLSGAPRIMNADDYNKLPAGVSYYDPQGNLRTKGKK